MERGQEEMQFLGVFGIYQEACKIIISWRKIFTQITLALILPLSFIYLAHIQVSNILFAKIINNKQQLDGTQAGTKNYHKLSDRISSDWAYLWLFKAAYFTGFFIFSLLSTAAVVYTIASIYTGRDVSFNKVMSVVPKVWKRLMVTFLSIFAVVFAYNVVALIVLFVVLFCFLLFMGLNALIPIFWVWLVLYLAGLFYMITIWQLASVVSVLEEACGFKAMRKSKALMKGKMGMVVVIFFKLSLSFVAVLIGFEKLVVLGYSLGTVNRVSFGIICLLLLLGLFLFGLVIHTLIYFVCKSFHHENIDKSALSDHLEVFLLGEYVPLKSKDLQLQEYQV